jgi:hypothetical protein
MKSFMKDLIERLTSRKFLLTVSTALVLIANKQWDMLVLMVGGYVGVEGIGDAAARYAQPKAAAAQADLESTKIQLLGTDALPDTGVDKSQLVAGNTMAGQ